MKPFEQVVAEYGPTVLRVCRAVVGPVDADDAWSETFLAAMRAYPGLDDRANIEAWLVTIAHRKAIDITRRSARAPVPVAELPDSPSRLGIPGEKDDELWDALRTLPLKQRQAVASHYLGGLPHKEVADILGGTTEAARKAASDGISTLRRTYASRAESKRAASKRAASKHAESKGEAP